jgi:hypothetical protein
LAEGKQEFLADLAENEVFNLVVEHRCAVGYLV